MSEWKWCVEQEDGTVAKGWYEDKGNWYFLKDNGTMAIGWLQDKDERWYYLNSNGTMKTGWLKDKDKWYYLETSSNGYKGSIYTEGMHTIEGKEYKFDSSGALIENKKYKGIDVSNNNGNINFNKVKADGIECAYIKATEGTTYRDNYLDTNYSNARYAGLKTGFYHFLVGTSEPETQATNFYNAIKDKTSDLIPMLDIETAFSGVVDYAIRFIFKFKELVNMSIGIYTYSGFMSNLDNRLSAYPLWEANYNNSPWSLPGNSIWNNKVGHQYTEKGIVNGINTNVDLNEFTEHILM